MEGLERGWRGPKSDEELDRVAGAERDHSVQVRHGQQPTP
jgi:hypothetical protein